MNAVKSGRLVSAFDAHQLLRDTLHALPGYVTGRVARMGEKDDCWCLHACYTVARWQVCGIDLFPRRKWLQVVGEQLPGGKVQYQLFASRFPTLTPGFTGESIEGLIGCIGKL